MSLFPQKAKQTLVLLNTLFSGFPFVYSQRISNILGNTAISGSARCAVSFSEHLTVMPERYQLKPSQVLQLLTGCCGEQLANLSLSAKQALSHFSESQFVHLLLLRFPKAKDTGSHVIGLMRFSINQHGLIITKHKNKPMAKTSFFFFLYCVT